VQGEVHALDCKTPPNTLELPEDADAAALHAAETLLSRLLLPEVTKKYH
jgi:hypothetical protein